MKSGVGSPMGLSSVYPAVSTEINVSPAHGVDSDKTKEDKNHNTKSIEHIGRRKASSTRLYR